jgi:hypothetical protein
MGSKDFVVSGLTPRVQSFCELWFIAENQYLYAKKFLDKDFKCLQRVIDREGFIRILEDTQSKYNEARDAQRAAHPDAHLMLMLKVKGGWCARWWAQVKGARQWKDSSEQFKISFGSFLLFYKEMLDTDLWAP